MDCIILAGGIPGVSDLLYACTQGKPKALVDVGGRTLVQRVVDAAQQARAVEQVVVVGLEAADVAQLDFARPVASVPDQGTVLGNALAGIHWVKERRPHAQHILICASDVPCLTGAVIDGFIELCRPYDHALYYPLVTQAVMEARFPGSVRTYVPIKGERYAGGDVFLAHSALADADPELIMALFNARKHAWKLARVIGPMTLLRFLLRRLSLQQIEATGQRLLGQPVKVVICPYAEVGMDVDKPAQLELLHTARAQA